MSRNLFKQLILASTIFIISCTEADISKRIIFEFDLHNPHEFQVEESPVQFSLRDHTDQTHGKYVRVYKKTKGNWIEIPSQTDDLNGDGIADEVFFLVNLDANATEEFSLAWSKSAPTYEKRTQAFLKVQTGGRFENGVYIDGETFQNVDEIEIPDEQAQDSRWAYMEGPVWESDLVGYRFYLDARNRVDIYGKSIPDLVLDTITTNYHLIHDWGTDVLKVGASLGLGSIAAYRDGQVKAIDNYTERFFELVTDGPLRSVFRTTYNGWQVFGRSLNVVSEIEIHAGNRYTDQRITVSGDSSDMTFVTGIVKHPDATPLASGETTDAVYGWTGGLQSDQGHELFMNVAVPRKYQPEIIRVDPLSYLFTFRLDDNGHARYRYASAWAFDHQKIDNFENYTRKMAILSSKTLTINK